MDEKIYRMSDSIFFSGKFPFLHSSKTIRMSFLLKSFSAFEEIIPFSKKGITMVLSRLSLSTLAKKDSLRNQNDYQVDLKSELILERIHDDIEEVLKKQKQIIKLLEEDDKK